jgi:aspartate kinase
MEENLIVRGIAFEDSITRVTIYGLPQSLGALSTIFTTLAKNRINVDIIIQSMTAEDTTNLSFSTKSEDTEAALIVLENNKEQLGFDRVETESGLAKVSIVGSGMVSNPGVAAEMFEVMANTGIQVKMVSTSEIKVSTVVNEKEMVKAVESLHEAFKLGQHANVLA